MRTMRGFTLPAILSAAIGAALLGGCGTTEKGADPVQPETSAGPVSVTDTRGKAVNLGAPARRVVGLEWGEVEMLVTLGVMPVGVADIKGYGTWVTAAPLDAAVKDVGTRGEPSVDSIVALQPDLVVMAAGRDSTMVGQLERFVPVLVTKSSDAADNLGRLRADFTMIATAVGKRAEATRTLADFDAAVAAGKKKIADAGAGGQYFAMADGWREGGNVNIRMFGQGALVSQIGIQLGLRNAWDGKVDAQWGLGQSDVEGLTAMKDKDLRFFYNNSDGEDVFTAGLGSNAIWNGLPFVAQKKLHKLPNGIWTFGGPKSGQQFIDALVKVYAG